MKKEIIIPENRDFKGVWIPRKLYESREFTPNEKFLILEIYSLSSKGSCYASNAHFADFVGLKENTIQKMIAKFEESGYLTREFEYKENSPKEIKRRWLTLTNKFYKSFINECEEDSDRVDDNQWGGGNKSEGHGKKSMRVVDKNSERSNTSLSIKLKSNKDLSNTHDKYAFTEESVKGDNIYSSSPEVKEDEARIKRNRFIPSDYSYEQLREHILTPIEECVQSEFGGGPETVNTIADIVVQFCKDYENHFGRKHRVPTDDACKNIVFQFYNPPEVMDGVNDFESYMAMMVQYFKTNFNQNGGYGGTVEKSVSHFMSRKVRENLYYKTLY